MTHVHVLDMWDEARQSATVRVFSSKEDARRAMDRFLDKDPDGFTRYAEVVKRKVK